MIQDYLYLIDYTKVFSIGAAKSTDLAFMRLFAGYTHSILDGEMDIHPCLHGTFGDNQRRGGTDAGRSG